MKIKNLFLLLVCLVPHLFADSVWAKKNFIFQNKNEWVALSAPPQRMRVNPDDQMLLELTEGHLQAFLERVEYRETLFVSLFYSAPKKVFSERQSQFLAQKIYQGLKQAQKNQVVSFSVSGDRQKNRVTRGYFFMENEKLNLLFECINRFDVEGYPKPYQPASSRWQVVPAEGQALKSTLSGDKGKLTNWLVSKLEKGRLNESLAR